MTYHKGPGSGTAAAAVKGAAPARSTGTDYSRRNNRVGIVVVVVVVVVLTAGMVVVEEWAAAAAAVGAVEGVVRSRVQSCKGRGSTPVYYDDD